MGKRSILVLTGVLMISSFGLTACGGASSNNSSVELIEQTEAEQKSGRLIEAKLVTEFSNGAIQISQIETRYPVKVYQLVYETKGVNGTFLNASGLVSIPQKPALVKSPTILYHHGTIYENRFAPTENVVADASPILPAYIGFISVAPDYIGFGESKNQMHPYLNADVTASSSIDLLRATQTFLEDNNIQSNDQLFLGGYSQGGSATLSTQRKIESELSDEFTITASSAGAGAYALSKELLENTQTILEDFDNVLLSRPSNIGLIMKSMDDVYDLNILNELFSPEYVSVIETIYDGTHDAEYIDSQLTKQASKLFKPAFLQRVLAGNEPELVNAFEANDLFDWSPKAPTQLYHGREDDWVGFTHAQTAYDTMLARGVSNVELVECNADADGVTNHANCFVPYLFSSYEFFLQYANDL